MPGVIDTRTWVPTVAEPTAVYTPSGSVTARASVQITNSTLAELWIGDSQVPPASAESAKYVVPARATAEYPLESAAMAVRWAGTIAIPGDQVQFVFSDEIVSPRVTPGVIPSSGAGSPVQSAISNRNNIGVWPLVLTTESGLNIGAVYVYNNTSLTWYVQTSIPGFKRIFIDAYSWASIPLNQPSGSVDVNTLGSLINGLLQNDAFYVAWGDITSAGLFPAGAGRLPDPTLSPAAARVAELPTQQFYHSFGSAVPTTAPLRFIGPNVGAPQRVLITSMTILAQGPNAFTIIEASRGYNGLGGVTAIMQTGLAAAGGLVERTREAPLVIVNLDTSFNNVLQVTCGSGLSEGSIAGYILT